jgi:NADH:ubiquinone oxidoreductase subunit H
MVSWGIVAGVELLIFPGLFFIFWLALFYEWVDRKFHAKIQTRYGPLHIGAKGLYTRIGCYDLWELSTRSAM